MANKTTSEMKNAFANLLINDANIVSLIDATDIEYPDDLKGSHIFPILKVTFTEEQVGTYIGLNITYPSISRNELYKDYVLKILVISHNDHVMVGNDSRVDLLAEEITKLFNWNDQIGFTLELKADSESVLDDKHYCRELAFKSITSNNIENGVKRYGR